MLRIWQRSPLGLLVAVVALSEPQFPQPIEMEIAKDVIFTTFLTPPLFAAPKCLVFSLVNEVKGPEAEQKKPQEGSWLLPTEEEWAEGYGSENGGGSVGRERRTNVAVCETRRE